MRILFLDDDLKRHKAFSMQTIGCNVKYVMTAKECMLALFNDEPYDLVCLDHDLGGKTFQEEKSNSGTEVAEFIRLKLPQKQYPKKIIVHSWNPQGAQRMMRELILAGIESKYLPFRA